MVFENAPGAISSYQPQPSGFPIDVRESNTAA
jgi:hypothetical protein